MSEHKYREAYLQGYRDGQKAQCMADAIDDAISMLDKLSVTNGDMIKAMFPSFQINEEWKATRCFELRTDCTEITGIATSDWWNAPYKRGSEDEI